MESLGVFIDPSEYRRNNFEFGGDRLTALADLASKGRISLLQTDVSISEIERIIMRAMDEACTTLRRSECAPLKAVNDARMSVFRNLPTVSELNDILFGQFKIHLSATKCVELGVSSVDPSKVFASYFRGEAPFDSTKKKTEFPDAFTHQRLVLWAIEHGLNVAIVGPDPDLERICSANPQLQYFKKIEELLDHINYSDKLVHRLKLSSAQISEMLTKFVEENFPALSFELRFHPHGEVEEVLVADVTVHDIYALEVQSNGVQAEAIAQVIYSASFSYEDLDSGFYDAESKEYFMTDEISGETEDDCEVSLNFRFSLDEGGDPVISDVSFHDQTITVREEDRGDYDAYK